MTYDSWFVPNMAAVIVILSIFVATLGLLLWLWQTSRTRQLLDKIPGPKALPLIGNAHMLKTGGYEFFQQVLEFCDTYSDGGMFRILMGPFPAVVLYRANKVETLLNSSKHITKSREYDLLKPWLATGLLTSTGDKWKVRRKLLTPTFHFKILTDFMQVFNEQASILVENLEKKAAIGKSFNIFPDVTHCALDIICDSAMGRNVNAQNQSDSEYVKAVWKMAEIVQERMKAPWLRPDFIFHSTQNGRTHEKCLKILHDFTRKVITERSDELDQQLASSTGKVTMEDLQTDKPFLIGKQKRLAFLDMLLIAAKGGAGLTHADIQEEVDTFMFEGHDTTAAATSWALFLLGHHPEILDKVRRELQEVFEGEDRTIEMDDMKKLKYLECVAKEALRLHPSVPMIAREVEEDCVIGGYTIPKGTSAMIIVAALHKDPAYFPDPEKFDPDRWLPENSHDRHPYCYIPFSAGHRNCIGQKFAQYEERVLLAYVLRKFTLRSLVSREDIRPLGELIQRPEQGVTVQLTYDPVVN